MAARPKAKSLGKAKKDTAGPKKATKKLSLNKEGKQIGHAVESLKQQRALFRRDSNEQANRAIKLKLGMFPQSQIENNTFEGKQLPEVVKAKVKECKRGKKTHTTEFLDSVD